MCVPNTTYPEAPTKARSVNTVVSSPAIASTDVVISTQTAQLLLPAGQKVWVRITPRGLFSIKDKNTKKMQTYTSKAPLITIQRDFDTGELFIQPYKTVKSMN